MKNLVARPVNADLIERMRGWYEDEETRRFVHGPEELDSLLDLIQRMPGTEVKGAIVTFRQEWAFLTGNEPVGSIGAETYDHERTSVGVVVAPKHRGRGVGAEMLRQLPSLPGLEETRVLEGGVEPENTASIRMLRKAGFTIADEVDHEGFLMAIKEVRHR
ncbi:MAG: GNAT family protein [Pseudomonadota bacterium]